MSEAEKSEVFQHFGAYSGYDQRYYDHFNVKRGLRNADGTGVVAGITSISNVHGYLTDEGVKIPDEGRLTIRGYDIKDLVDGAVAEGRPGYEEVAYLLLTGDLPTASQLESFRASIDSYRDLPRGFVNNLIMNFPSKNVMNMMARSVLMLYAMDSSTETDVVDPEHEVQIAVQMLSRLPRIAVLSYLASRQHEDPTAAMYINPPLPGLSTAETVLHMLRHDMEWTPQEARMLDIMLMLHAEHGGGNNSTFTTRVLTSSGTDAYSAYAGGICSLKGPKHGGANIKVAGMHQDLMDTVADYTDEGQVADYLRRILRKEAYDRSGLIYGMGHAVYTLSDPRAVLCKKYARELAQGTEFEPQFELIETIERLSPELFREEHKSHKVICANIDMYSGLVYKMLGIPQQLYTPLFATARIAGWAAHRFEEIVEGRRIIRPAYKSVYQMRGYVPMEARENGMEKETAADLPVNRDYYND
ncbi:MAG: citrate synthase [Coriobacteriales bacterium]|nr:citrate synthase [Coriobacteriaceae bacterium]MDY2723348.1 citrate synthase [Coriobacteriales bacterium]